jgi:hypothetical protein
MWWFGVRFLLSPLKIPTFQCPKSRNRHPSHCSKSQFQHFKLPLLTINSLNFPWANRCISLDLWWNHAVEQQAFGRIFRIGQEKDTFMTRIVVKNSVDMRLLSMQLHKLQNLEKVRTHTFLTIPSCTSPLRSFVLNVPTYLEH